MGDAVDKVDGLGSEAWIGLGAIHVDLGEDNEMVTTTIFGAIYDPTVIEGERYALARSSCSAGCEGRARFGPTLAAMTTILPALDATARLAIAARTELLFRASGAFREGHFLLKSGRHGDAYVEKFAVLSDPAATSELCSFFAAAVAGRDGDRRWSTWSPARRPAASSSRSRPARQLGVRSIFAEEVRDDDGATRREFRRGFHIEPGERVLLVDDILTTGGSLLAMIPAVEALGGEIVECAVLVDRGGGHADPDVPDDRAGLPAPLALGPRPADLRARRRRRVRAAPTARRSTRLGAPGPQA